MNLIIKPKQSNLKASNWQFLPGRYLTIYLFFSIFTLFINPFITLDAYYILTMLYAGLVWFSFYLGQRTIKIKPVHSNGQEFKFKNANKTLLILSLYTIIIVWGKMIEYESIVNFEQFIKSIFSPGESYFNKFIVNDDFVDNSSVIGQIYTLSSGIVALLIPFGCYAWTQLSRMTKTLLSLAIISRMLPGLVTGTMIDVALVLMELGAGIVYLFATEQLSGGAKKLAKYLVITGVLLFFFYGSYAQLMRAEHAGWMPWIGGYSGQYQMNNVISLFLGDRLGFGANVLVAYINHTYEGLMQCLMLDDFEWTYGLGHSRALMEYADQYLGWDWIWSKHMLWRNQMVTGRDPLMIWATALPWIASDVTFFGVPFVIYLFGKFFGKVWQEAIIQRDPVSLAIFTRLVIFVIFLPANNQIFQGRVPWWATIELFMFYFIYRKFNNKHKKNQRAML